MHSVSGDVEGGRRLTVALAPFNTAYDYELTKLPHDIIVLGNTHQEWNAAQRPFQNLRVTYVLDALAADVLVLGVDQWSFHQIEKRMLFLKLRDQFPGPKIIVNHGCNMLDGCSSKIMRDLAQTHLMVCSSAKAKELWNVANGKVVRRGYTPIEWHPTNYSRGNVVAFEPGHHRHYYNADAVDELSRRLRIKVNRIEGSRKFGSFDAYRAFLASSAIFFNPSYAAPNLQAMVEAQLCGLAVVTTNSHDEREYIENGENGFASNNMEELYAYVDWLLRNPRELRRVGSNGRRTAQRFFHTNRFMADWNRLLLDTFSGAELRAR